MHIMAIGDLVRIRIYTRMEDQLGENVIDYRASAPVGGMTDKDLADAFSTGAGPFIRSWLTSVADYMGVSLQCRGLTQLFVAVTSNLVAGAGTGLGDPMPKQVCGVTTKLTELGGPANRGRVYWPFPFKDPADVTGKPTPGQKAKADDIANQILQERTYTAGPKSITLTPVIVHKRRPIPEVTPPPTDLTGHHFSGKWGTQRRRGDYGAPNAVPVL